MKHSLKFLSVYFLAAAVFQWLLIAPAAGFIFPQKQDSGFPGEYLMSFSPSGRAAGLAGAYSTFADEPAAFYYNPAAFRLIRTSSKISLMHSVLPNDFQFTTGGYAIPYGLNTWAFNFVRFASPQAERTNTFGDNLGTFQDAQSAYFASFSRQLKPGLGIGANVKIATQNLDDSSDSGCGVDVGIIQQIGLDSLVGLALQNIGGPRIKLLEKEDTFPMALRGGYSRHLFAGKLILSIDFVAGLPSRRGSFGIEYSPFKKFFFRGGLNQRGGAFGFGFQMRRVSFDYAAALNDLGITHFFSTGFRLALLTKEEETARRKFQREKKALVEKLLEQKLKHGMEMVRQKEIITHLTRARIFTSEKRYIKARRELEEVLKIEPGHKEAVSLMEKVQSRLKSGK